ncbi:MAG: alpha/beta hydrolase [Phycisphaerales bacterium]|nr:alpha/beta hydrolase [Phycisphaerales bacterium]
MFQKNIILFIMLLTAYQVYATKNLPEQLYGNNTQAGRYIQIRNFNMYVEQYGKEVVGKYPILFIGGNGGSINDFKANIPFFAKQTLVIAADSRAQGKSTDYSDSLSYDMMATDFKTLLDSLNIHKCNVIGWSDGGIIALLMAIKYPEYINKIASSGANLVPDTTAITSWCYHWVVNLVDSLQNLKNPTKDDKNELKYTIMMLYQPHISHAMLATIKAPVLIIGGDHDAILPAHTVEIGTYIPNAYTWIVPDAGHRTFVNHTQLFNHTVQHFFNTPYHAINGSAIFE